MSRSAERRPVAAKPVETPIGRLRVAKRYAPHQAGAKRFALRYGDPLVCVRHRLSDDGRVRHTTIELLIESTPIVSRQRSLIAIRIAGSDRSTRQLLLLCGAEWKPKERLWLLPHLVAKNLRLLKHRVPLPG